MRNLPSLLPNWIVIFYNLLFSGVDCEKLIKENHWIKRSGAACPLTCNNYLKPPTTACNEHASQSCVCRPPYVQKEVKCVLPEECSNQTYREKMTRRRSKREAKPSAEDSNKEASKKEKKKKGTKLRRYYFKTKS